MASELEARVTALETVLDKYIPKINAAMAKTSKKNAETGAGAEAPTPTPARTTAGPVGLRLPAYDVMRAGSLIRVTAETLAADPELQAWMRKEHPDCFI